MTPNEQAGFIEELEQPEPVPVVSEVYAEGKYILFLGSFGYVCKDGTVSRDLADACRFETIDDAKRFLDNWRP
jgi:hypothetical protein